MAEKAAEHAYAYNDPEKAYAQNAARLAIRQTLAHRGGVVWPGEGALDWLRKHIAEVDDDNSYWGGPHKREYLSAPEILKHLTTQVKA
jgi:hypothetical protein